LTRANSRKRKPREEVSVLGCPEIKTGWTGTSMGKNTMSKTGIVFLKNQGTRPKPYRIPRPSNVTCVR